MAAARRAGGAREPAGAGAGEAGRKGAAAVGARREGSAAVGAGAAQAVPATDPGGGGAGAGLLYVVATPIGNLGDVTLRALETLRSVPLVAAEDTRVTLRLLTRHGIAVRLVSYHERNAAARTPELLAHLRAGTDLALVTDAGTPVVSDPGAGLVSAWAAEGGRVVPIPGPSAVVAAVSVAGVVGARWTFEGFLPRSGRDRKERLAAIAADPRASVVYEAPTRLAATLRDLAAACGEGRAAAVCRELTKIHESVVRGSLGELRDAASDGRIPARGEIVLVVGEAAHGRARSGAGTGTTAGPVGPAADAGGMAAGGAAAVGATDGADRDADGADVAAARAEVERLVAAGTPRGEAARTVARRSGIPRRALYGAPDADRGGSDG